MREDIILLRTGHKVKYRRHKRRTRPWTSLVLRIGTKQRQRRKRIKKKEKGKERKVGKRGKTREGRNGPRWNGENGEVGGGGTRGTHGGTYGATRCRREIDAPGNLRSHYGRRPLHPTVREIS
jgi:hypothetical protein